MQPSYTCEIPFGSPLYDLSFHLRTKLLREPLGLHFTVEDIQQEYLQHHLVIIDFMTDRLLGCLVMKPISENIVKMRQVAIDHTFQKSGLGSALVRAAEHWATGKGYRTIELNARKTVEGFYHNLGYESIGEEFTEVNIPHIKMQKTSLQESILSTTVE